MRFKNRKEAGKLLAEALIQYYGNAVVYALPRGGVVLGAEIAQALHVPLDIIVTRKIGHPLDPEYAIAAVAEDGHLIANESELEKVNTQWLTMEKKNQMREARRRRELYLTGIKKNHASGKVCILVDDGVATGLTLRLGILELREHYKPEKIVVAVPVVSTSVAGIIKREADELVALDIDEAYLGAVAAYYEDFPQVEDEEVISIMARHI